MPDNWKGFNQGISPYLSNTANMISQFILQNKQNEIKLQNEQKEKDAETKKEQDALTKRADYYYRLSQSDTLTPELLNEGMNEYNLSPNRIQTAHSISKPKPEYGRTVLKDAEGGADRWVEYQIKDGQIDMSTVKELEVFSKLMRTYTRENGDGTKTKVWEYTNSTISRNLGKGPDDGKKPSELEGILSDDTVVKLDGYYAEAKQAADLLATLQNVFNETAGITGFEKNAQGEEDVTKPIKGYILEPDPDYIKAKEKYLNQVKFAMQKIRHNILTPEIEKFLDNVVQWTPESHFKILSMKEPITNVFEKFYKKKYVEDAEITRNEVNELSAIYYTIFGDLPPWTLPNAR